MIFVLFNDQRPRAAISRSGQGQAALLSRIFRHFGRWKGENIKSSWLPRMIKKM